MRSVLFNSIFLGITIVVVLTSCSIASSLRKSSLQENNKRIALSYIEDVVNKRKLELVREIFSPAYTFHGSDGTEAKSIEKNTLIPFLEYLFKAFPDLRYTVDDVIAEKDRVALNLSASGTHQSEFLGFAASDNTINFKELFFFKITNSKITDGWGIVNMENVKAQLKKK